MKLNNDICNENMKLAKRRSCLSYVPVSRAMLPASMTRLAPLLGFGIAGHEFDSHLGKILYLGVWPRIIYACRTLKNFEIEVAFFLI